MKIAVFGGSFDPVHNGHVQLAEAAINELALDLILLMPAYIQPFKRDRRAEFSKDRINMLNLAFTGFEHCKVSSYEIDKGGISYSIDTLRHLRREFENGENKLYFIMGSDSLFSVEDWKKGDELLREFAVIVGDRPDEGGRLLRQSAEALTNKYGAEIFILNAVMPDISSSSIRDLIESGSFSEVRDLIPCSVFNYIIAKGMYKIDRDDSPESDVKSKILAYISERLSEKRFLHTLRVCDMALKLAHMYDLAPEKVEIAALLHDMARGMSAEDLDKAVIKYEQGARYLGNINLSHAKVAALFAREIFGICDEDILNAISYHTTGRAGMSPMEMVIYLADAVEYGRDYDGVAELRALALGGDLERACCACLRHTVDYLKKAGIEIDKDTLKAYDYLKGERKWMQRK